MAIEYKKLQSKFTVLPNSLALTAGAVDILVVDMTAGTYQINNILLAVANATITGDLTVLIKGNTAANGSGTDTIIASKVLDSADTAITLEVNKELIAYAESQAGGLNTFLSIVIDATGTGTDSFDSAVLIDHDYKTVQNTPSDT